jgi:hypothetical protein
MLWLTNTMYSVTLEMLVTFVAEQHACQICFGLQGGERIPSQSIMFILNTFCDIVEQWNE